MQLSTPNNPHCISTVSRSIPKILKGRYHYFIKLFIALRSSLKYNIIGSFASFYTYTVLGNFWDVQKSLLQHSNRQEQSINKVQMTSLYTSNILLLFAILTMIVYALKHMLLCSSVCQTFKIWGLQWR